MSQQYEPTPSVRIGSAEINPTMVEPEQIIDPVSNAIVSSRVASVNLTEGAISQPSFREEVSTPSVRSGSEDSRPGLVEQ